MKTKPQRYAEGEAEGKVEKSWFAIKEIDVRGKEIDGFSGSLLRDGDEWEGVERMEFGHFYRGIHGG